MKRDSYMVSVTPIGSLVINLHMSGYIVVGTQYIFV